MEQTIIPADQHQAVRSSSIDDKLDEKSNKTSSRSTSLSSSQDISQLEHQQHSQSQPRSESDWASISQIIVAFFLAFNTWGLINTFGVFQTYYTTHSPLTRGHSIGNSQISWIGSLQACLVLFTLVFVGPLFDRGYARALTIVGTFLDVFGMMMTSVVVSRRSSSSSTMYWQLMLCQGLCVGLGFGCLFIVAVGQIALTFKRRRWLALGLAQSGGSIGAIVYSEIFRNLWPIVGFGWATRTIAFIMLVTLVTSVVLLRPHQLPKPRKMIDVNAFRSASFNTFAIASFTGFMGLYIPFFYIQQYSLAHGLANHTNIAYSTVAILNAGSVLGRIVPGFVADELGLLNTYSACSVGAMAFGFIWVACRSLGGIVSFAIFYGFFSGCTAALQPAVLASLSPTPNLVGTWVGMGSLFSSTGLLIGSPLGGLILDHNDWVGLQLWCGCLVLASSLATLSTRVIKGGSDLRTKV